MEPLRALIVDDEEPARDRLCGLLSTHPRVTIVGTAGDGVEALRRVAEIRPDLLFLDIEMPGMSGIELAAALPPPRPQVVFCTAYEHYALEAFEQQAMGYLLKPVRRDRLERTLQRLVGAVAASRGFEDELDRARQTQARLYPRVLPEIATLEFAGLCRPARAVGGDYYDFLPLGPGRLGLALGDVSGKGLFAALLMAGLQARLQSEARRHGVAVDRLLGELARRTHESTEPHRYATLFYAHYDETTRRMTWANAAQLPPFLLRAANPDAEPARLGPSGPALGLMPGATYRREALELAPGDLLCLISDGVSEARSPDGEEWGEARVVEFLRRHRERPARELCAKMAEAVTAFTGDGPAHDDLTLVVARAR